MATVTKSIGTTGRDYSTITLWEADLDDSGIYASGDIAVGEMYDDTAFDEFVTINGGGTIGLTTVTLQAAAGEQHDGTAGTGARIVLSSGSNSPIVCDGTLIHKVIGVEIDVNGLNVGASGSVSAALSFGAVTTNDNRPYAINNLVHGIDSPSDFFDQQMGMRFRVGGWVYNNIVYSIASWNDAYGIGTISTGRILHWLNNTVHDISANDTPGEIIAFDLAGDTSNNTIKNNLGTGAATCFNAAAHSSTVQDHNASSDSTAVGTGSLTTVVAADTYVSTVAGSEDLKLKSGAVTIDSGTDLSAFGVTDDIIGTARPQNSVYDIGAHEFTSSGITASGTPESQSSTISGSTSVSVAADGSMASQASTVSASASVEVAVSGTLAAASSNLAGAVEAEVATTGALASAIADVSGSVSADIGVSGSVDADAATIDATASADIAATGDIDSAGANVSGSASADVAVTSSLESQAATVAASVSAEIAASGSLEAASTAVDGSVAAEISATGDLASEVAVVDGNTAVEIAATGALSSGASTTAGDANTDSSIGADGTLASDAATISGAAAVSVAVTGTLAAQASDVTGQVAADVATTGALAADSTAVSGAVAADVAVTGDLSSDASALSGAVAANIAADGTLATDAGTIDGAVAADIAADGALAAQDADVSGSATVTAAITVSGDLSSAASTVAATASPSIAVIADIIAASPIISGSGTITVEAATPASVRTRTMGASNRVFVAGAARADRIRSVGSTSRTRVIGG